MRKFLTLLGLFALISIAYGCILSYTPKETHLTMDVGDTLTFCIGVFPSSPDIQWDLDGEPIPEATGKCYEYSPGIEDVGEHTIGVCESSNFGKYCHEWTITVFCGGEYGYWPMYGHDRQHTGRSASLGPQNCGVIWEEDIGNITWWGSAPVVGSDGTIYIGSNDYRLYAFEPNGTVKWYYETGDEIRSTPAIGCDGSIYVTSKDGFLYAINSDGTFNWKTRINTYYSGGYASSPVIGEDCTIYVGGNDGLYSISPSGGLNWCYPKAPGKWVLTSPAIDSSGTIYFATYMEGFVYAMNPDGSLKWKYEPAEHTWFISSPSIGCEGTIYIGEYFVPEDRGLLALNPNGTFKWKYVIGADIVSTPAIAADCIIYVGVGDSDNGVYAIKPDGSLKWIFDRDGILDSPSSPAIASDGTIYIGSLDGYLYTLSPSGGCLWSCEFYDEVFSPAIGPDFTLYVPAEYKTEESDYRVKLYAIESSPD